MLALPSLAGQPVQMVVNHSTGLAAALALALLDSGRMQPRHWQRKDRMPAQLCERALCDWWVEHHPTFAALQPMALHATNDRNDWRAEPSTDEVIFHVVARYDSPRHLILRDRVLEIERTHRGWGYQLLQHVDHASRHCVQVLTPTEAFGMASWVYWQGADDESDVLQMLRDEGEDPAQIEIYTAEAFYSKVPRDALYWQRPRPGRRPVSAPAGATRWVVDTCNRIRLLCHSPAIERLMEFDMRRNDSDGGAWTEFGAVVRWTADDDALRIADDWFNAVCQEGTWETLGSWRVPAAPEALQQFLQDLEVWMQLAEQLDALLGYITRPAR